MATTDDYRYLHGVTIASNLNPESPLLPDQSRDFTSFHSAFKQRCETIRQEQEQKNCTIIAATACTISLVLIPFFAYALASMIVAHQYDDTPCIHNFHTMKLTTWLLVSGIIDFTAWSIGCLGAMTLMLCCGKDAIYASTGIVAVLSCVMGLFYSVYNLAFIIIGIIELAKSFPLCIDEAYGLCVMVIIAIIMKFLSLPIICKFSKS